MPRHPPYALSSLTIKKSCYLGLRLCFTFACPRRTLAPASLRRVSRLSSYAIVKDRLYALVEVNGFEPMTSCVQGRRSPS